MRIVVKIGTSTLTHATGHLNIRRVAALCQVISDIKNAGHEVILVSSGAIGMGVGKLGLRQRPKDIPTKQAAAAVGQCELMYTYDKLFSDYHHTVAQLLITGEDVASEKRHQNLSNTRNRLLDEVWGFGYFGDSRTVDVHVKRLREKIEGVAPKWELTTVWGVGYKFKVNEE